jgi:hypothetical protein
VTDWNEGEPGAEPKVGGQRDRARSSREDLAVRQAEGAAHVTPRVAEVDQSAVSHRGVHGLEVKDDLQRAGQAGGDRAGRDLQGLSLEMAETVRGERDDDSEVGVP